MTPPKVTERVTAADATTARVGMLTEPDDFPALTRTLPGAGTAIEFELPIVISVVLADGAVKVKFNSTAVPPVTVAADRVTDPRAGGFTVTVTVLVTPPELNERVTVADADTALVGRVIVPDDCPAVTGIVVGGRITFGIELLIEIVVPLTAGAVKLNCKDTAEPPPTVEDAGVTDARAGFGGFGGFTVRPADAVALL